VTEIFGQNNLLKLVDVLDDELSASRAPVNNAGKVLILNKRIYTLRISKVLAINPATSFVYSFCS
jgi:hypothetical protein